MQPKPIKDTWLVQYKTTLVEVDLSQVNDVDLIEWYKPMERW
jgi:hypothetical protein